MVLLPAGLKPIFHLATLFARREAKKRIRQRDSLKLVSEKIHREQVGIVPIFFPVRANKFAKWKIGLIYVLSLPAEAMKEKVMEKTYTFCLPLNALTQRSFEIFSLLHEFLLSYCSPANTVNLSLDKYVRRDRDTATCQNFKYSTIFLA